MKTILVFNATGKQGSTIVNTLLENEYNVIAPVRSQKNIDLLNERNIQGFLTNFSKESLVQIIKKADKVVLQIPAQISPSLMIQLANNAIEAIKEAGAPPTVFVISSTVPTQKVHKDSPDARFEMKQKALETLPNAIILSATEYLENFSTSYREAIEKEGMIPQTIPDDLPVNYLSWNDLAIFVEATLRNESIKGGFYQIGGNEGINGSQLANRLGTILEKKLFYHTLTHQQLQGFLTPIVGQELASELAEFYEWQDTEGSHLLNPDTTKIRSLLGIKLPNFEDWAKKAFLS